MKAISVQPDITVREAMKTLTQLGEKCLVIINEKNHLLGTLSVSVDDATTPKAHGMQSEQNRYETNAPTPEECATDRGFFTIVLRGV